MKTRNRHPLDGFGIMKLDEITLSEESLSLLSQILMDLGVKVLASQKRGCTKSIAYGTKELKRKRSSFGNVCRA